MYWIIYTSYRDNSAVIVSNFESKVLSIETLSPQIDILSHYYKQLVIDIILYTSKKLNINKRVKNILPIFPCKRSNRLNPSTVNLGFAIISCLNRTDALFSRYSILRVHIIISNEIYSAFKPNIMDIALIRLEMFHTRSYSFTH